MKNAQLICAFLLIQLISAPISAAIPVGQGQGTLTAVESQNAEEKTIVVRKRRATSSLLKGAAVGAVLGLGAAAAYNLYKNRQSTLPPQTNLPADSGTTK